MKTKIALLGIDCATQPKKTGLALGELRGEVVHILRCATGTRNETPTMIVADWLSEYDEAPDVGGSLEGLNKLLDCSAVPELTHSKDTVDAAVCTLAAADFLLGRAIPPVDHHAASIEGWIWAPSYDRR